MRDPARILVVGDVPDNLDILQMRLESQGYEVVKAGDGVEALEKVRELLPDLVLLDIMMPRMNGIEAVKRLKRDTSLPFIPVILVTARADAKDVIAGLESGGDDYLTKPVDHAALSARRAIDAADQDIARHCASVGTAAGGAGGRARRLEQNPAKPRARTADSRIGTRKTITLRNEAERLEPCIIEREEARQRLLIHNAPVGGLNRSRTTAHQISAS
jgi:CheY-like chemotaxis protein